MLWPKEAGRFIAARAKDVHISEEGVKACAESIATAVQEGRLGMDSFKQNEVLPLDKGLSTDQLIDWTFLVDAINFSFWTKKSDSKFTIKYKSKTRSGYLGMVSAVNRAIDEGKLIYDPKCYSQLSMAEAKRIFRSDTKSQIPLLERRVEIMKEVGSILITRFEGSFKTVVDKAGGSAMKLIDIIQAEFPSFRDIHTYDGQQVAILKRAQIVAADLSLLFKGKGLAYFPDIDELSMFADYRVPQTLVHYGVIAYSNSLLEKLHKEHLFNTGDREEVEIRGVSIHAVELIVSETREILGKRNVADGHVNSAKVDFYLWDFRIANAKELDRIPYHKTRCIYY